MKKTRLLDALAEKTIGRLVDQADMHRWRQVNERIREQAESMTLAEIRARAAACQETADELCTADPARCDDTVRYEQLAWIRIGDAIEHGGGF